ncbi:FAD-dependent monooxygenase [Streptomyces sp. TG1A-60]|uniref:FAD-dependent monooxygenase n=1 Tax=Streptomyces sp. TG1A-60 TaxID=3129111 RepID=UPI0030D2B233
MRTPVGVIGGPAGLLRARLPHRTDIDRVVLESRTRAYAERRRRAGLLERGTADALRECGAAERPEIEGRVCHGIEESIYARGEHGFALRSMRSPSASRLYLQVANGTDPARTWRDRAALRVQSASIANRAPGASRTCVHGAGGLNLGVSDVGVPARAFIELYDRGSPQLLDRYSRLCLDRVRRATRFSYGMTRMPHTRPDEGAFDHRLQLARLRRNWRSHTASRQAAAELADNDTGLPLTWWTGRFTDRSARPSTAAPRRPCGPRPCPARGPAR